MSRCLANIPFIFPLRKGEKYTVFLTTLNSCVEDNLHGKSGDMLPSAGVQRY